jgi:hypothetical protein
MKARVIGWTVASLLLCAASMAVESPTASPSVGHAPDSVLGQQPGTVFGPVQGADSTLPQVTANSGTLELPNEPTVTLLDDKFKLTIGGAIFGDFFFNSARPVAPATPYYLTPRPISGFRQETFDASARQSVLFAYVTGPKIGDFDSGAEVRANFYSNPIIADQYGILPLNAFGYLQNDDWRFAAGLQPDIFNPLNPTVLPFTVLIATGNVGLIRSQVRIERFVHPSAESQITLTLGASEPIPTLVDDEFKISEDNGWPNIEERVAVELGPLIGEGRDTRRPFEVGFSGVVGQIRTTIPAQTQVVADVWGIGSDLRWAITDRSGVQGEFYTGQTLGTYGGGILQDINSITFEGVRSTGGWCEVYYYICPEVLHTHFGYGIDDPLNSDLAQGQRLRNETYFSNLIWDVTQAFRLAGEFTYRKTSYLGLPNNHGVGFQSQVQWRF